MIKAVIFDLDDTLFDEIDFVRSGFRAVARLIATLSDNASPDALYDHFLAMPDLPQVEVLYLFL